MNKYIWFGIPVALALSYAAGRYATPAKIITNTVTVEKVIKVEVEKKNSHIKTVVTETPGKKTTVTTEDNSEVDTIKLTDNKQTEIHKEIDQGQPRNNVALLGGLSPTLFKGVSLGPIVYGVHYQYRLLGPIQIGAWATSNTTAGVSLGFTF